MADSKLRKIVLGVMLVVVCFLIWRSIHLSNQLSIVAEMATAIADETRIIPEVLTVAQPATIPDSIQSKCTIQTIAIHVFDHTMDVWGVGDNANYSRTFTTEDFPEIAVLREAIEQRIGE